jgi:hypothetical protein
MEYLTHAADWTEAGMLHKITTATGASADNATALSAGWYTFTCSTDTWVNQSTEADAATAAASKIAWAKVEYPLHVTGTSDTYLNVLAATTAGYVQIRKWTK